MSACMGRFSHPAYFRSGSSSGLIVLHSWMAAWALRAHRLTAPPCLAAGCEPGSVHMDGANSGTAG